MAKRPFLAIVAATFLSLGPGARAASADEFAQIRQELQSLLQRVDRLEQENTALKARNEALQEQGAGAPVATNAASDAVAASWPERILINGDIRYRHQATDDERQSAERGEELLRARFGLKAKVTESIVAGIGAATSTTVGSVGNPRSGNVQLDGEFSRKPLYLDLGYVDWKFMDDAHAVLGKMNMPFTRPGQSLFWDNDINPEGIALTYQRGIWFGSAYDFWVEENVQTGAVPSDADTTDTKMYGGQIGARMEMAGDSKLTVAAMYYDLAAAQGRRPFFNGSSNGNSLDAAGGLLYDFQVLEVMADYSTRIGDLPLQAWVDWARNADAELDTAIGAGVLLGKASGARTWEAGLAYQMIEKDALFAQHIDGDFLGLSDAESWILRAGYTPVKNWTLNATWFLTTGNVDIGDEFDYQRLQLDFNVKF